MNRLQMHRLTANASETKKKILLCFARERPQVVTQAVYGLGCMTPAWLPDEVIVITDQFGAHDIEAQLVCEPRLKALCDSFGHKDAGKVKLDIQVMPQLCQPHMVGGSLVLSDSRRDIGNFILRTIARITDDPQTELWVSLGADYDVVPYFFAGHALSLLGRPQDRLVQVVKHRDTQSDDDFCCPRPETELRRPEIGISDVPFARIECIASVRDLARQVDYSTLCQGLENNAHLQVTTSFRGLQFRFSNAFEICCDSSHHLPSPRFEPRAAALYAFYARRALVGQPFVRDEQIIDEPVDYLELYDACLLGGRVKSEPRNAARALSREALRSARSRIARTLKSLVKGGASYADYRIYARRADASYGLDLSPDQIVFSDTWSAGSAVAPLAVHAS